MVLSVQLSGSPEFISHRIPGNFMGLSLEWCNPPHFAGNTSHPHHTFTTILPYLSTRQGLGPTIRIGGSSSDRSVYNPKLQPPPPWKDFVASVVDDVFIRMDAVAAELNISIIAGVSFRFAYNMSIAGPWVAAIDRLVGWQRWRIEIGNEQDIYDDCNPPHSYEDYRPCGWGWDNFTVEWDWEQQQIISQLPHAPKKLFQGGAFCCPWFESHMAEWTIPRAQTFSSFSFHRYIWNGCGDYPTLAQFLSDYAGLQGLQTPLRDNITFASSVAEIHRHTQPPLPVYLGEGNSIGCQGQDGKTDTYAQVLWLLDYCMALSSFNVSGMHFYVGWTDPQTFLATPFYYEDPDKDEVTAQATIYGMWMFALATWQHARIISTARVDSDAGLGPLKSWTLLDADHNVVVLLVHKDYNTSTVARVNVSLALPNATQVFPAHLVPLTAPSVTAKQGIALAGLSWDGTTNGRPRMLRKGGRLETEEVQPVLTQGDGAETTVVYSVSMRPVSVLLLVIPTRAEAVPGSWKARVASILQHEAEEQQTAES